MGKMAIGSRLRLLTDSITRDALSIYAMYGVEMKPKWFPVFISLTGGEAKSVTSIAKEIGQTHASVSTIAKEMIKSAIVEEVNNDSDRRKTMIALTDSGRKMAEKLMVQCHDVRCAVEQISNEADHDLWQAIAEWEMLLQQKSLCQRVAEIKAKREAAEVEIVEYDARYQDAYFTLNRQWIEKYWALEPHDIEMLSNPQKYIIEQGGHIYVALISGRPVGVVALCKLHDSPYDYELAKLAVDTEIRGKGIGRRLCEHLIGKAIEYGADTLFLESNTSLRPAIALYGKLGFKELDNYTPAYARGDIQMSLNLKDR